MNIGNTLIMPRTRVVLSTGNMQTVARNFANPKTETEILSKSAKASNVKKIVRNIVAAVLKKSKTIRTIVKNNPVVSRAWGGTGIGAVSESAAVNSGSGDVFKSRIPVTLDGDEALAKRLRSREKLKELILEDRKQKKAEAAKLSAKKSSVAQAEPKEPFSGESAEKPVSEQSNCKKMSKARFNEAVLARLEEKSKKRMRALEEAKIAQNKTTSELSPENFSVNDEMLQWL